MLYQLNFHVKATLNERDKPRRHAPVLDPGEHRKRSTKRTTKAKAETGRKSGGASKQVDYVQVKHPYLESWEKIRESLGDSGGLTD